jgi:hypothetical protein
MTDNVTTHFTRAKVGKPAPDFKMKTTADLEKLQSSARFHLSLPDRDHSPLRPL